MTRTMEIDFISDIMCPWCVIGLRGLDIALERIGPEIDARIRFQPFELNPDMPVDGQNVAEHVAQKYGSTPEQSAGARAAMKQRAADLGFAMNGSAESRIWNSFDAHRLIEWAGEQGGTAQHDLKMALFTAHFSDGRNVTDHGVLVSAVVSAGLDGAEAARILASDAHAATVRAAEEFWRRSGVQSVPTIIIDGQYLISGGQPPEIFEKALRRIAAEPVPAGGI